ncbi:MAG: FlaA1/EpsC-like NDP-sugar epimerase, partial [Alteromonadaceae bacterium]
QDSKSRLPVVIYGAGSSGRQLALSLQHGVEFQPIAFVDDKLELQQMSVSGMRVYPRSQLVELVGKHNVTKVLLAIPSASAQQRKKIISEFDALSVELLTIPGTADLVSGKLHRE